MTIKQVKDYFIEKNDVPCPMTEKLVKAGYQQISGGYIDCARREENWPLFESIKKSCIHLRNHE